MLEVAAWPPQLLYKLNPAPNLHTSRCLWVSEGLTNTQRESKTGCLCFREDNLVS